MIAAIIIIILQYINNMRIELIFYLINIYIYICTSYFATLESLVSSPYITAVFHIVLGIILINLLYSIN
jgi:hypothetical protein